MSEQLDDIIEEAKVKAVSTGFDQVIFRIKNKSVVYEKISSQRNLNPRRIIGYIVLKYRDGNLSAEYQDNYYN